jgi:hypothetical protein
LNGKRHKGLTLLCHLRRIYNEESRTVKKILGVERIVKKTGHTFYLNV